MRDASRAGLRRPPTAEREPPRAGQESRSNGQWSLFVFPLACCLRTLCSGNGPPLRDSTDLRLDGRNLGRDLVRIHRLRWAT